MVNCSLQGDPITFKLHIEALKSLVLIGLIFKWS